MKNIRKFAPIILAVLSIFCFMSTDYNLFGLFDGFGWGTVIFSIFNYILFLMFLSSLCYHIVKWISIREFENIFLIQYGIAFILFLGMFLWMDNREPFPNSSYSESSYK